MKCVHGLFVLRAYILNNVFMINEGQYKNHTCGDSECNKSNMYIWVLCVCVFYLFTRSRRESRKVKALYINTHTLCGSKSHFSECSVNDGAHLARFRWRHIFMCQRKYHISSFAFVTTLLNKWAHFSLASIVYYFSWDSRSKQGLLLAPIHKIIYSSPSCDSTLKLNKYEDSAFKIKILLIDKRCHKLMFCQKFYPRFIFFLP
jgi:hypothetical protein